MVDGSSLRVQEMHWRGWLWLNWHLSELNNVKSLVTALLSRATSGSCCKECFALPTLTRKLKHMFLCGKLSNVSNALQPVACSAQLSHPDFVTLSGNRNMHISDPITAVEYGWIVSLVSFCHSFYFETFYNSHRAASQSRELSLAVVRRCWEPLRLWQTSHMHGMLWLDTKRLWYRVNKYVNKIPYTVCSATARLGLTREYEPLWNYLDAPKGCPLGWHRFKKE